MGQLMNVGPLLRVTYLRTIKVEHLYGENTEVSISMSDDFRRPRTLG